MIRLQKILRTIGATLALAYVLAWARSDQASDGVFHKSGNAEFRLISSNGLILVMERRATVAGSFPRVGFGRTTAPVEDIYARVRQMAPSPTVERGSWRIGFYGVKATGAKAGVFAVVVSYRMLFCVVFALVLPVVWFRRVRPTMKARNRRRRGLCTGCGYDLRGSPERCSECGAVISR